MMMVEGILQMSSKNFCELCEQKLSYFSWMEKEKAQSCSQACNASFFQYYLEAPLWMVGLEGTDIMERGTNLSSHCAIKRVDW